VYWDINGQKQTQERKAIVRRVDYKIDLAKLSYVKKLKLCTSIHLINRSNTQHQASLIYQGEENSHGGYSSYKLITSCGAAIENVIQEATWSHCGRYLAVVHFEHPPSVPKRISTIDFETGTVRKIAGVYALPSFIWFDKDKLEFTHVVGTVETIESEQNDPRETYRHETIARIAEPEHIGKEYELLITKKLNLEHNQEKERKTNPGKLGKYSQTTIAKLAQHCILFAPDFDAAVLQPPKEA
jgi:hypothetical protein